MIEFNCPECGKKIKTKSEFAGRAGKCSGCGNKLIVPQSLELDEVETSVAQPAVRPADSQPVRSNKLAWLFGASTLVLVVVVIGLLLPKGATTEKITTTAPQPNATPKPVKKSDGPIKKIENSPPPEPMVRAPAKEKAPPPPAQPRVFKTGEIAIAGGIGYKVESSFWSNSISANALMDTPPRAAYLNIVIGVVNGNEEPYLLPPLMLIDENGTEYARSPNDWVQANALKPIENLNPQVVVVGSIAFDVPKNHQYRLMVKGGVLSPERAYISLQPKDVNAQPRR